MPEWNTGQALQGALGGASTGAAAGAAAGPWGAGIGGAVGLLGGLFGGGFGGDGGQAEAKRRQEEMWKMAQGRPDIAGVDWQNSEWLAGQRRLAGQLQDMAAGRGPSLAGQMLQQNADRSSAQQAGLAAGAAGRGVSQGAALRNAAGQQAALQMQAGQDAAIARTREQEMAMQQLAGLLGQARGQDLNAQQFNVGNQQANWSNRFNAMLGANGQFGPPQQGMGTALFAGGMGAAPMIGQGLQAYGAASPQGQAGGSAQQAGQQVTNGAQSAWNGMG